MGRIDQRAPLTEMTFKIPWSGRGVYYFEDEIEAVLTAMRQADPLTQGRYLTEFEEKFTAYQEGFKSFAVSSGAAALELSALLAKVSADDEVIIPAHTYCATAIPFARRGCSIKWADSDPDYRVVTRKTIEPLLTKKTKVIVVVHLYGVAAPIGDIAELAREKGIILIEDCAQAVGARCRQKKVGTFGDMAVFSFHAQKNMTTLGEGGMISVKREDFAGAIPGLRHNGHCKFSNRPQGEYWRPAVSNVAFSEGYEGIWPYNFSIGEVQCAVGIKMLEKIDSQNAVRYQKARRIIKELEEFPELKFQAIPQYSTHVYYALCARYDGKRYGKDRNDVIRFLASEYGVQAIVQYYPLYRYPLFAKGGYGEADCPNSDDFFDHMISLPFYVWFDDQKVAYLIDAVQKTLKKLRIAGKR